MLKDLPRPTVFAHRGASAYAPENTLAAFELALRQEAHAIELDAKLSADGQVVVIHDQSVDRTTNSAGKVADLTLAEMKELDAGSHYDIAFQGEKIPTLDEVFAALGNKIFINVELTNYAAINNSLPEKTAELVRQHHLEQGVMFSSFNPIALIKIRKALPGVPAALLALSGRSGAWARSWIGCLLSYQALHPEMSDITAELVHKVHRRGCRLHAYTVNQQEDMRRLFNMQVDGIFTDDPVKALEACKQAAEQG